MFSRTEPGAYNIWLAVAEERNKLHTSKQQDLSSHIEAAVHLLLNVLLLYPNNQQLCSVQSIGIMCIAIKDAISSLSHNVHLAALVCKTLHYAISTLLPYILWLHC